MDKFLDSYGIDDNSSSSTLFLAMQKYKEQYSLQKMLEITIFSHDEDRDALIRRKIQKLVTYVTSLKFEDRPDHKSIRSLI